MVTIEDVDNECQDSPKINKNEGNDEDPCAWKDLMGKDIRFRLLSSVSKQKYTKISLSSKIFTSYQNRKENMIYLKHQKQKTLYVYHSVDM